MKVQDILADQGRKDEAGNEIICVYFRDPPAYAVYRTPQRVVVCFADDEDEAREQRGRLSPLTPLRGQITALINGWQTAGQPEDPAGQREDSAGKPEDTLGQPEDRGMSRWWRALSRADQRHRETRKRAERYNRRVADAIVTGLENDVATAHALLADVKNDIISERTSMARNHYLVLAFVFSLLLIAFSVTMPRIPGLIFSSPSFENIWTGLFGGTVGAFYSIAIGLRGRQLVIDLQNRDNRADALLRVLIGTMSGGLLICLLLTELVRIEGVEMRQDDDVLVFVVGFVAGFFERLVPDMLSKTNLGTKEGEVTPSGTSAVTPHPSPNLPAPDQASAAAPRATRAKADGAVDGPPASALPELGDQELSDSRGEGEQLGPAEDSGAGAPQADEQAGGSEQEPDTDTDRKA